MSVHKIKVVQPYFDALVSGDKPFEVRLNDRAYQRGDRLELVEAGEDICDCTRPDCYKNPRRLIAEITFVYSGDPRFGHGQIPRSGGIEQGYVVLGIRVGELS